MAQEPEYRPQIEQGIDRKALNNLRQRFMRINQIRLRRVLQALPPRQLLVLQALPMLFDSNHPLLPGFVSRHTPCGLSQFAPDDDTLKAAHSIARSFSWRKPPAGFKAQIHALYLMGSGGTIGQSDKSDLDVWVCHDPALDNEQRAELDRKCRHITDWAATQGCEAHFYLVDADAFSRGERDSHLSSEDCGSAQHYLLLDEFYRTAILLAGRHPRWWLVPDYAEHNYPHYAGELLRKRFIRADDSLELGHLALIPPGEYVGAGLWQLFKGIDSPYKSVLKLLLTEVYASEHPHTRCLSLEFKHAIYQGRLDPDELDPYVMLYRRIEGYLLGRGERERLELVRRCLYVKADVYLSRRSGMLDWKRVVMEKLVREWQWDSRQLQQMDQRHEWKVREVTRAQRQLVGELTHSYRLLSQFGRSQNVINQITRRDLTLLGRRLYAAFERKAGKIELLNPGISPDLGEALLTLALRPGGSDRDPHWNLYRGNLAFSELSDHTPLKRSRELMELLSWGYRNGLIDPASRLTLHPGDSDLSESELQQLITSLRQHFPLPLPALTEAALSRPALPCKVLLVVNAGIDPLPGTSQKNLHLISSHTDALGYSGLRDNLVRSIDQISLNSWNEMQVNRHQGEQAWLQALCDYLNRALEQQHRPELEVACFCRNRGAAITERIQQLFNDCSEHLLGPLPARLLLQDQHHYRLLERRDDRIQASALLDLPALVEHLGEQPARTPLILDSYALRGQDLALILQSNQPRCIQLFYRILPASQIELSVLDEAGALWRTRLAGDDEQTQLLPLLRFLHNLRLRRELSLDFSSRSAETDIRLYQLLPPGNGLPLRIEARNLPDHGVETGYLDVQAIAEASDGDQLQISMFCGQREFSQLEYGSRLYHEVAAHILRQRRQQQTYPCYITDLDLSLIDPDGKLHTVIYLKHRERLEQALNQALQSL